jgi:hypothetical protein
VVATGLEPVAGKKNFYKAQDFDILFDSPNTYRQPGRAEALHRPGCAPLF